MTVSTHVYSAVLIGSPDVPLNLRGGSLSLDAGRTPHVQGSISISLPTESILSALDPRDSRRVRVEVDGEFPSFSQHREFDLGLRERDVEYRDAVVGLTLASDEAVLSDYAPLSDDTTPLTHQDSLRDLIGYVLDEVIPGATLEPGDDIAVPALAESENLIRNPRAAVNVTDYAATWSTGGISVNRFGSGGPTDAPTFTRGFNGSSTTGGYLYYSDAAVSVTGGKTYVMSCWVRTTAAVSLDVWMLDATPTIVGVTTPTAVASSGSWVRVVQTFTTTPTTTKVRPRIVYPATMPASTDVDWTGLRLSEFTGDPTDIGYYDGDTPDTAQYAYSWGSQSNASPARRTPLIDAATPEALTWRAGQSALDFLIPIFQRFGLRLVCDETRTWTLRDESYTAPGTLNIRHAVNLIDGTDTISRDSGLWFDARVTRYRDRNGVPERIDAYALTTPHTRLTEIVIEAPYPGPGRSEYAVRRAQGRGREVTATTVSNWAAHAEQPTRIVLDGSPTQIGTVQSLTFDLDTDEMRVSTRTIDAPDGVIDLLDGTIDSLTGTIDSL